MYSATLIFADIIKLIQHDWRPYRKWRRHTQRGMTHGNRDRDWDGAGSSQAPQRIAANNQKLGKGKERVYPESQRESGPADTLISVF
jgi:hypothetical protein